MQDTRSPAWTAPWITTPDPGAVHFYRREVDFERTDGLMLRIAAERSYVLHVNGRFVQRGSVPSQPYYKFFDVVDVSAFVRPGRNVVAVEVLTDGAPVTGLRLEVRDGSGALLLGTDATWRVTARTGWVASAGPGLSASHRQGFFDAGVRPEGWTSAGFDDGDWPRATLCMHQHLGGFYGGHGAQTTVWTRLVQREIPPLEEFEIQPVAVTTVEEGLDLNSRGRAEALSVLLSAAGQPLQYARLEGSEHLLEGSGDGAMTAQCSTEHLRDRAFDGIYAPSIVLDFGKVQAGYAVLEVDAPAGATVDVGYVERLVNGHFNNAIEVNYADRFVCRAGSQRLESNIWKSFRYVKLRFSKCVEPMRVKSVKLRVVRYPYVERGGFTSSDATLSGVFEASRHTVRLCSRDHLMDTPWRERTQWVGDAAAVTLPAILTCFGDTAMPRQFLLQSAQNAVPGGLLASHSSFFDEVSPQRTNQFQRTIPDFSMYWIEALWDYYLYTGDGSVPRACWPQVQRIFDALEAQCDERGLLTDLPWWVFVDHVFMKRKGTLAFYAALHFRTLGIAEHLARAIGDAQAEERFMRQRQAITTAFDETFYDADAGLYRDSVVNGQWTEGWSEHSNVIAIASGLASPEKAERIVQRLFVDGDVNYVECQPFMAKFSLLAMTRIGRRDLAIAYIRDRWGRRMIDKGLTSVSEEWNASGSHRGKGGQYVGIFRSLSHAWSAWPAVFLIRELAGIKITQPGCADVEVDPYPAPFDYEARYPMPGGAITVTCRDGKVTVER